MNYLFLKLSGFSELFSPVQEGLPLLYYQFYYTEHLRRLVLCHLTPMIYVMVPNYRNSNHLTINHLRQNHIFIGVGRVPYSHHTPQTGHKLKANLSRLPPNLHQDVGHVPSAILLVHAPISSLLTDGLGIPAGKNSCLKQRMDRTSYTDKRNIS